MRYSWPKESVEYLKQNYGIKATDEIALKFGISKQAVVDKASKLGLKAKEIRQEYWSKKDDLLLQKHFEYAPKNMLMNLFPNRSWPSITQRGWKTLLLERKTQDKINVNYNFFEEWTEESSYVFGFIMADGYLVLDKAPKNTTSLQIDISINDREILEKIAGVMDFQGKISDTKRKSIRIYISNRKIAIDLHKKGLPIEDKTNTASWPINIPNNMVRHFIRGYYDGDGSVYEDNTIRMNIIGTYDLLKGIANHLPKGSDNKIRLAKKGNDFQYRICFGGSTAYEILDWLYKDAHIYLERKYNRFKLFCEKYNCGRIKTP